MDAESGDDDEDGLTSESRQQWWCSDADEMKLEAESKDETMQLLAWNARVRSFQVPSDVSWTRFEAAECRIHYAEFTSSRLTTAVGIERRQSVHSTAHIAEVLPHAPSDCHSAVSSWLHQYDLVCLFTLRRELLVLTVLHHVSWHNINTLTVHFCRAILCISAAYAVARCPSVLPSVRLYGSPSRSCILLKRLNIINLNFFTVGWPHHSSFSIPNVMAIFRRDPPQSKADKAGKNRVSRPIYAFRIDNWWSAINNTRTQSHLACPFITAQSAMHQWIYEHI